MTVHPIDGLSDPRLDPYRHLRTSNLTRYSGRFIAESKPLVARLVASGLEVESILVDTKYLDEAVAWIPPEIPILAVPSEGVSELIGFHFHRGYLACGRRPTPRMWPEHPWPDGSAPTDWTGAYLIGVQDPENMGSILRSCAAFGIQDVLLGPECVDPFARRVLRVSMGNAFKLHFFNAEHPLESLAGFHRAQVASVAACLHPDSVELSEWKRSGPAVVLLGNEARGLPTEVIRAASVGLRIDMALGTDSLNVSVAAGIILHYACRLARR